MVEMVKDICFFQPCCPGELSGSGTEAAGKEVSPERDETRSWKRESVDERAIAA